MKYPKYSFKQDRRRKLSDEQLEQIKSLRAEGKGITFLANKFNVSPTLIRYHTDEEYKKRIKQWATKSIIANKKLDPERYREYQRSSNKRKRELQGESVREYIEFQRGYGHFKTMKKFIDENYLEEFNIWLKKNKIKLREYENENLYNCEDNYCKLLK